MTRFLDGPAAGRSLSLRRDPLFLRVVSSGPEVDALDQLDDVPKPSESVHVYAFAGSTGTMHTSYRDGHGRRRGRWESLCEYRYYPAGPDEATLRDTEKWRAWCVAEAAKLFPPKPVSSEVNQ